jgi:hypothetical protein
MIFIIIREIARNVAVAKIVKNPRRFRGSYPNFYFFQNIYWKCIEDREIFGL